MCTVASLRAILPATHFQTLHPIFQKRVAVRVFLVFQSPRLPRIAAYFGNCDDRFTILPWYHSLMKFGELLRTLRYSSFRKQLEDHLAKKHYLSSLKVDDAIAGGDDVEYGKPDPRTVGIALRKPRLPASQTIMLGDTPYDAEAGAEAGVSASGVLTGGFSMEALTAAGCFAAGRDVRDLLPSLETAERPH
jgi:Haloacid dehalogenase-like hydrolase